MSDWLRSNWYKMVTWSVPRMLKLILFLTIQYEEKLIATNTLIILNDKHDKYFKYVFCCHYYYYTNTKAWTESTTWGKATGWPL